MTHRQLHHQKLTPAWVTADKKQETWGMLVNFQQLHRLESVLVWQLSGSGLIQVGLQVCFFQVT